jgi:hypothetical protein
MQGRKMANWRECPGPWPYLSNFIQNKQTNKRLDLLISAIVAGSAQWRNFSRGEMKVMNRQ